MSRDSKIAFYTLGVSVFWTILIFLVFLSALPRNPISLPYVSKLIIKTIIPEGWSFFTRDPREDLMFIYKKDINGNWVEPLEMMNGSKKNFYGLKRNARALGSEYGLLFSQITLKWDTCATGLSSCFKDKKFITIKNQINNPLLCGEFLFITKQPVPWAWSKKSDDINLPYQFLLINLVCN